MIEYHFYTGNSLYAYCERCDDIFTKCAISFIFNHRTRSYSSFVGINDLYSKTRLIQKKATSTVAFSFISIHPEGIEPPSQEPESYVISITLRVETLIIISKIGVLLKTKTNVKRGRKKDLDNI